MNNNSANPSSRTLSIAITGSGGSGVVTTGNLLLKVIANAGFYGLMTRSAGPQIRGGESAAMVRIGTEPVNCLDDQFEILMALDWLNVSRFAEEIPLTVNSIVICDPEAGEIPPEISRHGAQTMEVPLKMLSKEIKGGRINMVGLGVLTNLLGLSEDATLNAVDKILGAKGKEVVEASRQCIQAGYRAEKPLTLADPIFQPGQISTRWDISGNEASGLGALRGGIRFVAAYPITPASEILEWLAPNLEKVGGALLQAEDELASINMIIGASFGGVPSLTATSGPGLSLMMEGLGLALIEEHGAGLLTLMHRVREQASEGRSVIRASVETLFDYIFSNQGVSRMILQESMAREGAFRKAAEKLYITLSKDLANFLTWDAKQRGVPLSHPQLAANSAVAILFTTGIALLNAPVEDRDRSIEAAIIQLRMIMRGAEAMGKASS